MWKELKARLTGVSPLIMHNGQLADPTNPITIEISKLTSKRKKTLADHEEIARLEFQGGLYMGEDGPVLPAHVLETTFISGAKKTRDGITAKAGMFVEKNFPLEYEGPKDREGLWADKDFRIVAKVGIGKNSIMRTRPIFNEWAVTIALHYDNEQANESQVIRWLEDAGRLAGLCDWRPKYGRFQVEVLNGKN